MPKELFDQPLIETPDQPDDNDRIAISTPGATGGKNILWSYLKSLSQGAFDILTFNTAPPAGALSEGQARWNVDENTLDIKMGFGTTLQAGQEMLVKVYNNSGVTINEGDVVYQVDVFNGYPTIAKALSNSFENVSRDYGIATSTMLNAEYGMVTSFGKVRDLDTSLFSAGNDVYLSPTVPGGMINTIPEFPNYAIKVGVVSVSHATDGVVSVAGRSSVKDTFDNAWDGCFRESIDFLVTSNGSVITGTLTNSDGINDLTAIFASGFYKVTAGGTLTLTAGTDAVPQTNYVYMPVATKVLTLSTSGWPTDEHIKIAYILLRGATATATDGALVNQNWNDHIKSDGDNGHILHIAERMRQEPSRWSDGVAATCTIGAGTPNTVTIANTSGHVYQLHKQTFPAYDTATGDKVNIVNDSVAPFKELASLGVQNLDALGVSLLNSSFSFVLWGVPNKTGETSHLMINLPVGKYARNSPGLAENDLLNYSVYTIPNEFKSTGFLIARFTFTLDNAGNVWTLYSTQDLRGYQPNNAVGGSSSGGGVTVFTSLTDVPSSYAGQAGKSPVVAAGETGLEFQQRIAGLGTANYIPKFTAASTVGDSRITDDGTDIAVASGKIKIGTVLGFATNANDGWYLGGANYNPASEDSIYIGTGAGNTLATATIYKNIGIGGLALSQLIIGTGNVAVGYEAGTDFGSGGYNVFIGSAAAKSMTEADGCTIIGADAGLNMTNNCSNNTVVGRLAAYTMTSACSSNIMLGFAAGYYETGSNKLYVSSLTAIQQANLATAKLKALIYGEQSATTADQLLRVNGELQVLTGKLAIGTDSPTNTLEVRSSTGDDIFRLHTVDGTNNRRLEFTLSQTEASINYTFSSSNSIGLSWQVGGTSILTLGAGSYAGNVGINKTTPNSKLAVSGLPVYADNAAALTGGLTEGDLYKSASTGTANVRVVNAT